MFWRSKRYIFKYHDGVKTRYADPIIASDSLDEHPEFRIDVHPEAADKGDVRAVKVCTRAARDVFKLADFDPATGRGATEMHALLVLREYFDFIERLKKKLGISDTSPSPAEGESTSNASSAPTTPSSVASGSSETSSTSGEPTSSELEPLPQ